MNPVLRKMSTSLAMDEFMESMEKDEAYPVIVVGRAEGSENTFHVYTLSGASSDLVAETLIHILLENVGLDRMEKILKQWGQERHG